LRHIHGSGNLLRWLLERDLVNALDRDAWLASLAKRG
jgi:hypothetical protein